MTDEEAKLDYVSKLMDRALKNEHMKPELIVDIPMLLAANDVKHATNAVTKSFKLTAKKVHNDYLAKLKNKTDDVKLLINYRQFMDCYKFYKEECNIIKDMITEFHNYMLTWGNFINVILGGSRSEDQMHQYLDVGKMSDNDDEYIRSI